MSASQIGNSPGEPSNPLRGNIVSSACQSCKKKKAKCDGGPPPCTPCQNRHTTCVFAPELDQRRRLAKRTRAEEAQSAQRLAEGLILRIKNSDSEGLTELIETIRSGATVKEIAEYIRREPNGPGPITPESSEASQPTSKLSHRAQELEGTTNRVRRPRPRSQTPPAPRKQKLEDPAERGVYHSEIPSMNYRRRLMSIEALVEANPLYDLPARPWTMQAISNNLFSHLISLFLTWWAPYWNVLLEDGLVSALKSRDINHPLCSPFLVNAILAVASQLNDSQTVHARVDQHVSGGENFHCEAQSLRAKEGSNSSLTNLQALFVLWTDSKMRGKDEVAWALLEQMLAMHNELELSHQRPLPAIGPSNASKESIAEQVEQSFRLVAWANYNLITGIALVTQRRIALHPPRFGLPFSPEEVKLTRQWCAYPRRKIIMIPQNAVTNANCDLAIHCAKIAKQLFRDDDSLETSASQAELLSLVQNLIQWRDQLPAELQHQQENAPIITELHGMFYTILISARELISRLDVEVSWSPRMSDAHRAQQRHTIDHIREMMPILADFRNTYGYACTPYAMVQAASLGSYVLFRHLDCAENRQIFSELCTCLVAVGRRYGGWKDAVINLHRAAERSGIELPAEGRRLLTEFEHFFWVSNRQAQPESMDSYYARPVGGINSD